MNFHRLLLQASTFALALVVLAGAHLPGAVPAFADDPETGAVAHVSEPEDVPGTGPAELQKRGRGSDDRNDDRGRANDDHRAFPDGRRAFIGEVKEKGGTTLFVMDRQGRSALVYVTDQTQYVVQGSDRPASFADITIGMRINVLGLAVDINDLPGLASEEIAHLQNHRDFSRTLYVVEARRIMLPKDAGGGGAGVTLGVVRAISSTSITVMGVDGHEHTASLVGAIILTETGPIEVGDLVVMVARNIGGTLTALLVAKLGDGPGGGGGAQLSISKTPDSGSISVGSTATFTITVSSTGSVTATNVQLTDTLPGGLAWSESHGSCTISGGVNLSCSFGDMAPGTSQTVTVSATATTATTLNNTATATASNAASVSDSGTIVVGGGSGSTTLSLSKTPDSGSIGVGALATFVMTLTNTGSVAATNVTLSDALPGGLAWFENPDHSSCTITGSTNLSCSFGTLNPGASQTVTVSAVAMAATTLNNTATATASNAASVSDSGTIVVGGGALPSLSVGDASISEGNSGTQNLNFTVTLSAPAPAGGVTFDIATADGTATAASGDYVAKSLTGQVIGAGSTSYVFSVVVNGDTAVEPNETFLVNVTNVANATVADAQAVGTIVNDDAASLPSLSVGDASISEGNSGTQNLNFTVTLSAPAPAGGVTFDIATADGTATAASGDYVAKSLTGQSIPAGSISYVFSVVVNGDTAVEPNETFLVNVTNVANATVADAQAVGTIVNDDAASLPSLSVSDAAVTEGNSGTQNLNITVTLSAPAPAGGVTFDIATADVTATAASGDYVAKSLTGQSIPAGSTSYTFTVVINGDTTVEPHEAFYVNVTNVTNATVADGQGVVVIINDD